MPDDLYGRDILIWAEHQAHLLRRLAGGERVNETIDWPHIIEEVEDVGRSELRACESLLRQAMLHLLKLRAGADEPASHWRAEVIGFLADAAARYTPSMRQRLDMARLYGQAVRQAQAAMADEGSGVPSTCPWSLDVLLSEAPDIDQLLQMTQVAPVEVRRT